MASLSRDQFLSYIHAPRRHLHVNPLHGSPTKSTTRYQRCELRPWAFEQEARAYWDGLPDEDKTQTIRVWHGYWNFVEDSYGEPLTSEPVLKNPCCNAFQLPYNSAI